MFWWKIWCYIRFGEILVICERFEMNESGEDLGQDLDGHPVIITPPENSEPYISRDSGEGSAQFYRKFWAPHQL